MGQSRRLRKGVCMNLLKNYIDWARSMMGKELPKPEEKNVQALPIIEQPVEPAKKPRKPRKTKESTNGNKE